MVRGFTYIELVVTLAIMAVLATVAIPAARYAAQREKESELRYALREIRQGIDAYKRASDAGRIEKRVGDSGYPKSLDDLVRGVPDQASPDHHLLFFLRHLPRNPFALDSSASAATTWALRSYASPPDAPAAGDDVYDVYVPSDEAGLNGVPYKQW